jgi:heme exporter protein B
LSWVSGAWAILAKDVRSEVRTRAALGAVVLFAVVTLVVVSYTIGGASLPTDVHASLLWIIVFFAAMAGLSRTFVVEEERGTELALKLTCSGAQVFVGKLLFNLALLALLSLVLIPLVQILLPIREANWGLLALGLALGCVALAASATLVAAIVAQAGMKGALFTVLAFPILIPVLVAGVGTTQKAMGELPVSSATTELQLLVSYAGVMVTLAIMLFDFVWRD